jgi:CheY-like chemotaxis protein
MEAIGQLTGGIAHDFNNLLAVVLGNLTMAKKRLPADSKLQQLIDNSLQAADRGATLTKRMLAFARQQQLAATAFDAQQLVRDMSDLLQRSIGSGIQITTQFPLRLSPAFADPNQLELALLNLTVNARDAMPHGGIITIAASEQEVTDSSEGLAPGAYVCISVSDTGEGMDEATLARAAEPFFTTKGVGKGTGLGLSMIHGFASQSGGTLRLKSVQGQGTTAEIWLPARKEADAKRKAPELGEEVGPMQEPLCVLVVDDDELVLMNTTAMLEDLGHKVLEASSGEQALRTMRRAPAIQLVITDHLMPGMTGIQLIEALRPDRPDVPVILATGFADLPVNVAPGVARLDKPFRQKDLARTIAGAMRNGAGQVLPFRPKHN